MKDDFCDIEIDTGRESRGVPQYADRRRWQILIARITSGEGDPHSNVRRIFEKACVIFGGDLAG